MRNQKIYEHLVVILLIKNITLVNKSKINHYQVFIYKIAINFKHNTCTYARTSMQTHAGMNIHADARAHASAHTQRETSLSNHMSHTAYGAQE